MQVQWRKGVYTRWFCNVEQRIHWLALIQKHMHASCTYWSSVYLLKYVLATSIYCCGALGSELVSGYCYCFLGTTFREVTIWFSIGLYKGDWLMQIYLMFNWWIQSENLWNVVPERKEKVVAFWGQHLHTSTSASTRAKEVAAPFQEKLENERRL